MAALNKREIATVLAALRMLQESARDPDSEGVKNMAHFEDVEPLSLDEIDSLCERLNFGDTGGR